MLRLINGRHGNGVLSSFLKREKAGSGFSDDKFNKLKADMDLCKSGRPVPVNH